MKTTKSSTPREVCHGPHSSQSAAPYAAESMSPYSLIWTMAQPTFLVASHAPRKLKSSGNKRPYILPCAGWLIHLISHPCDPLAGESAASGCGSTPRAKSSAWWAPGSATLTAAARSSAEVNCCLYVRQAGQLHQRCHGVPNYAPEMRQSSSLTMPRRRCLACGHSPPERM